MVCAASLFYPRYNQVTQKVSQPRTDQKVKLVEEREVSDEIEEKVKKLIEEMTQG